MMLPLTQICYYSVALLGAVSGVQGSPLATRNSAGCSRTHDWAGQTREFSFQSSGGTRSYRIHLPSNYRPGSAKSLLIAYHGSGDNPANFERTTRFSDEGINPDTITVYPAGINVSFMTTDSSIPKSVLTCTAQLGGPDLRHLWCQ